MLSLRAGVTAWTATILAGMLAVFGSGWENIVFAIQLSYNLSLLAFLVQLLLIDHDGPPDRRDACAARCRSRRRGLVGIRTLLHRRRRCCSWCCGGAGWLRAIATVPQVLASAWWWLFWGSDPAGDKARSAVSQLPAYVNRGARPRCSRG